MEKPAGEEGKSMISWRASFQRLRHCRIDRKFRKSGQGCQLAGLPPCCQLLFHREDSLISTCGLFLKTLRLISWNFQSQKGRLLGISIWCGKRIGDLTIHPIDFHLIPLLLGLRLHPQLCLGVLESRAQFL